MRKFISWLLLAASLGAVWYQWHNHQDRLLASARILQARFFPCSSPVTYSIGAIDPGYTLSRQTLTGILKQAEDAWETPARKNLFEFRESSGAVTVNFIYDQRQAALDKLKALGISTDQSLASYKELKTRYEDLAAQVDLEEVKLKGIVDRYKIRETAYNLEVGRLNKRGSAAPEEARRVKRTKAALSAQFGGIKMIETAVNSDVNTLNALGTTLNQLIVQLNINVEQYNRVGSALGRYEEGLYLVENGLQSIDIYKYTDDAQLLRLLAHEMGHALGLDHTPSPESLMHPVNKGGVLELTAQDRAELNRVCRRP